MEVSDAFFVDKPKVGKHTIQPFTAGHFKFLKRRGNAVFVEGSEQDDVDSMLEIFFVMTRPKIELLKMRRASDEEWEDAIEEFALSLDPGDVEAFSRIAEEEFQIIEESHAVPVKTGKRQASRKK